MYTMQMTFYMLITSLFSIEQQSEYKGKLVSSSFVAYVNFVLNKIPIYYWVLNPSAF